MPVIGSVGGFLHDPADSYYSVAITRWFFPASNRKHY